MSLISDVREITENINKLHIEDPKISDYWQELTLLLTKDENETLSLLSTIENADIVEDISSVFDDVSFELQSEAFIKCITQLDNQFPEKNLGNAVEAAKNNMMD